MLLRLVLAAVFTLGSHSTAHASAVGALDILSANQEIMFATGVQLVQERPSSLLFLAALKGESTETLRALSKYVDVIQRSGKSGDLRIVKGTLMAGDKSTGIRIVGYAPNLTVSYRGEHWTYKPDVAADLNFESLLKFLKGKPGRSAYLGLSVGQAFAEDAIEVMTKDSDASTVRYVGGILGGAWAGGTAGALAGIPGGMGGILVGGLVGGISMGTAAAYYDPAKDHTLPKTKTAICEYLRGEGSQKDLDSLADVTYSCETSPLKANGMTLLFKNGLRKQGLFIQTAGKGRDCCEVRLSEAPKAVLGKISVEDQAAIKAEISDCAKPEKLKEAQERVRRAYAVLREAAGFCGGTGTSGGVGSDGTGAVR